MAGLRRTALQRSSPEVIREWQERSRRAQRKQPRKHREALVYVRRLEPWEYEQIGRLAVRSGGRCELTACGLPFPWRGGRMRFERAHEHGVGSMNNRTDWDAQCPTCERYTNRDDLVRAVCPWWTNRQCNAAVQRLWRATVGCRRPDESA